MSEPVENNTPRIDLRDASTEFLRLDIAARSTELTMAHERLQALREEIAGLEQHVSNLTAHTGHMEAVVRWRERTVRTDGDVFADVDALFERHSEDPGAWIAEEIDRGVFPVLEPNGNRRNAECLYVTIADAEGQRFRIGFELTGLCYASDGKSVDCGNGCVIQSIGAGEDDSYFIDFSEDVYEEEMNILIESGCPILFERLPPVETLAAE